MRRPFLMSLIFTKPHLFLICSPSAADSILLSVFLLCLKCHPGVLLLTLGRLTQLFSNLPFLFPRKRFSATYPYLSRSPRRGRASRCPHRRKYFSRRLTTSRAEPMYFAIWSWVRRTSSPPVLASSSARKMGQPPVGAHEEDLLHRPHGVGEALSGHLVGEAPHLHVLSHETAEDACADAVGLGVLFGVDVEVKVHRVHNAGGGEDADLAAKEAVEGHVPAIVGEKIRPELAGAQRQDAHAVLHRAVDPLALAIAHRAGGSAEYLLLFGGQLVPEGEGTGETLAVLAAFGDRQDLRHLKSPFRSALAASVPARAPS